MVAVYSYSIKLRFTRAMIPIEPPLPRLQSLQFRHRPGRVSTWPFRVVRDAAQDAADIRMQAARVIRTTAQSWWPADS